MNTKRTISAISVATVLALASPAYAGLLGGGAGGGFGGGLGGAGNGLGGNLGGGFGGHGGLDPSMSSTSALPAKHPVDKADSKPAAATKTATSTVAGKASDSETAQAATAAQPAKTAAASTPAAKPATVGGVKGDADQTFNAGPRTLSGSEAGSIGVEPSAGAASMSATGATSAASSN